jgi:hypothetical protein
MPSVENNLRINIFKPIVLKLNNDNATVKYRDNLGVKVKGCPSA